MAKLDLWSLLFIAGAVSYFVAFYGWTPTRWLELKLRLSWLLVPEVPLSEWVGGDWERFGMLDRVPILMVSIGILALAWAIGTLVINWLRASHGLSRLEISLFAVAIGLSIISLFTLLVGLAGLLHSRPVFATALVLTLLAIWWQRSAFQVFRNSAGSEQFDSSAPGWFTLLCKGLCLPFAIFIVLGGMLPPWHFDVREYHAQVPKEWYQQGQIGFMPHNVYGNMPLGAELHAVVAMNAMPVEEAWWWGTIVGKTVVASCALLTALAVYALGRRFCSREAGAVAALLFISTPWVGWVSMSGLIEGASAFYTVTTLLALLIWTPGPSRSGTALLGIAGFLAGSAVACKYPALLFVVTPALAYLMGRMIHARVISWKPVGVFLFSVLLGCGIWFGKNAIVADNPTYPLLYEVFGGRTRNAAKHEQWTKAHRAPADGYSATAFRQSAEVLLIKGRHASVLIVPFGLLGLFSRRHRRLVAVLAGMVVFVIVAWWLLTHRLERFLIPHLPFVAILGGLAATRSSHRIWLRGMALMLVCGSLLNFLQITSQTVADNRFFVSLNELRQLSFDDPKEHNRNVHRAHLFLNEQVAPGHRVLLCGEAQVFNFRVPILYNTCFDDCRFEALFRGKSRTERLAALRRERISHVFVFWRELDRYRSPGNYGYSGYVTRKLVREELVVQQELLRPVALPIDPENSEVFEVVGWKSWAEQE